MRAPPYHYNTAIHVFIYIFFARFFSLPFVHNVYLGIYSHLAYVFRVIYIYLCFFFHSNLGRGKKTKLKHLKKMMSMLGVIMCAKLSLMGPLAMVMIGAKALKALLLAVVSLTISKLMLLKKFKGGGGGGGYGSGSMVQADWSSDKDDRNAHLLAYAGQTAGASATAVMAPSSQQPLQQMYPSYEPHGYHGAA